MRIVKNENDKQFSVDGIFFAKIYQPLKQGFASVSITNVFDTRNKIFDSEVFSNIEIDGTVYDSQEKTIEELLNVCFNIVVEGQAGTGGNTGTGGADESDLTITPICVRNYTNEVMNQDVKVIGVGFIFANTNTNYLRHFTYDGTRHFLTEEEDFSGINSYSESNTGDTVLLKTFQESEMNNPENVLKAFYQVLKDRTGLNPPSLSSWSYDEVNNEIIIPNSGFGSEMDLSLLGQMAFTQYSPNGGNTTANINGTVEQRSYSTYEFSSLNALLYREFDVNNNEIVASRKFYLGFEELAVEPTEWDFNCERSLSEFKNNGNGSSPYVTLQQFLGLQSNVNALLETIQVSTSGDLSITGDLIVGGNGVFGDIPFSESNNDTPLFVTPQGELRRFLHRFIPLVYNNDFTQINITSANTSLGDGFVEQETFDSDFQVFENTASYRLETTGRFTVNSGGVVNGLNAETKTIEYFLVFNNGLFGTGATATNEILLHSQVKTGNVNNFFGYFKAEAIFQLLRFNNTLNTINFEKTTIVNEVESRTFQGLILRSADDTTTIEGVNCSFSVKCKISLGYTDPTNANGQNRAYSIRRDAVETNILKIK